MKNKGGRGGEEKRGGEDGEGIRQKGLNTDREGKKGKDLMRDAKNGCPNDKINVV